MIIYKQLKGINFPDSSSTIKTLNNSQLIRNESYIENKANKTKHCESDENEKSLPNTTNYFIEQDRGPIYRSITNIDFKIDTSRNFSKDLLLETPNLKYIPYTKGSRAGGGVLRVQPHNNFKLNLFQKSTKCQHKQSTTSLPAVNKSNVIAYYHRMNENDYGRRSPESHSSKNSVKKSSTLENLYNLDGSNLPSLEHLTENYKKLTSRLKLQHEELILQQRAARENRRSKSGSNGNFSRKIPYTNSDFGNENSSSINEQSGVYDLRQNLSKSLSLKKLSPVMNSNVTKFIDLINHKVKFQII